MESEDREPIFTRKTFLIILVGILAILIILLMVKKCGKTNNNGGGNSNLSVTGITVSPRNVGIAPEESYQITVSVEPATAQNRVFTCMSDNPEVVTVTTNVEAGMCIAVGVKEGTAIVYAETVEGSHRDGCEFTVKAVASKLTGITLDSEEYEIQVNEKKQVSVSPIPEDATITEVTYESSDTAIAEVSEKGELTGKKVGEATLVVRTKEGLIGAALVKVVEQKSCPDGQEKVDGVCVAKCKSTEERVDGKCVAKCKSTQKRDDDGKCVAKCKSTQELVDGKCVAKCKSTQVRNDQGKCVAKNAKVAPTKITLKEKTITLTVGDTFDIKDNFTITPETAAQKITCKVKSTAYLSQKNCVITAKKKISSTTVKVCTKADTKLCATLKVKIKAASGGSGGGSGGSGGSGGNSGNDTPTPGDTNIVDVKGKYPCGVYFTGTGGTVYAVVNYKGNAGHSKSSMFLPSGPYSSKVAITKAGTYGFKVWWDEGNPTTCSATISEENFEKYSKKDYKEDFSCGGVLSHSNIAYKSGKYTNKSVTVVEKCTGVDCATDQPYASYVAQGAISVKTTTVRVVSKSGATKTCKDVPVYYDGTIPNLTCSVADTSTGVKVTVTASDTGSGLKSNPSKTEYITKTTTYTATDLANNTKKCTITVVAPSPTCPSGYTKGTAVTGNDSTKCVKLLGSATLASNFTCQTVYVSACSPSGTPGKGTKYITCESFSGSLCTWSIGSSNCQKKTTCQKKYSCASGTLYNNNCYDIKNVTTNSKYHGTVGYYYN